MKPTGQVLRCYAEKQGDLWVAICIDLCLGAQDADRESAMQKLHAQIIDHVQHAHSNPQFKNKLLSRKAPVGILMKYQWLKLKHFIFTKLIKDSAKNDNEVFCEHFPLKAA